MDNRDRQEFMTGVGEHEQGVSPWRRSPPLEPSPTTPSRRQSLLAGPVTTPSMTSPSSFPYVSSTPVSLVCGPYSQTLFPTQRGEYLDSVDNTYLHKL